MHDRTNPRTRAGNGVFAAIHAAFHAVKLSLETLNRIEFDAPWRRAPCRDC